MPARLVQGSHWEQFHGHGDHMFAPDPEDPADRLGVYAEAEDTVNEDELVLGSDYTSVFEKSHHAYLTQQHPGSQTLSSFGTASDTATTPYPGH